MNKIGKVLRVPAQVPGLVSLEGQQHPFTLEDHWRSDEPPAIGMAVDAVLTEDGQLSSLLHRDLRQEATEKTAQTIDWLKSNGSPLARQTVQAIGRPTLFLCGGLLVAWQWMDIISISFFGQHKGLTLEQFLPVLKGSSMTDLTAVGSGSAGMAGLLMWLSLAAPLVAPWVRHRHAALLGLAPLAFTAYLFISLQVLMGRVTEAATGVSGFTGGEFARQMVKQINDAISLGAGAYATLAISLALAVLALRNWTRNARQPV